MPIKQLGIKHRALLSAIFWAIMLIVVCVFWPRPIAQSSAPTELEPISSESPFIRVREMRPIMAGPTQNKNSQFEWTPVDVEVEPESVEPKPEPEPEPLRYGFTHDDVYLLAQLLCGSSDVDGDGEYDFVWSVSQGTTNWNEIGKVLCVVMNRVHSDEFPNTVAEVVLQSGQFAVMPENSETTPSPVAIALVQEWCDLYDTYHFEVETVPETHLYFSGNGVTNTTREKFK